MRTMRAVQRSFTLGACIRHWVWRLGNANWLFNSITVGLGVMFIVSGVIILALAGAIGFTALRILDQGASATPLQHHQLRARSASGYGGSRRRRRRWGVSQSAIRHYASSKRTLWAPRAEGFDQMINIGKLQDTRYGNLGKPRLGLPIHGSSRADEGIDGAGYYVQEAIGNKRGEARSCRNKEGKDEKKHGEIRQVNERWEVNRKGKIHQYQPNRISIYRLPHFLRELRSTMPESGAESGAERQAATMNWPVTIKSVVGIMPRPGQPGALQFDGSKVTEFLKQWDAECDEYGLDAAQRCKKVPRYCTRDIGEAVEELHGYEAEDWVMLQKEMKQLFWQADPPKNTMTALSKLIEDAKVGGMTVDMYVLRYTTITEALVKKHAMSTFDRNVRLLEGLEESVQTKVFEHCSGKGWRMLEHDVDTEEPEFEDMKRVVLEKAKMMERKRMFVSGKLGSSRMGSGYAGTDATDSTTPSTAVSTVPTTATSPVSSASDPIEKLTEQISKLTLFLQGQPNLQNVSKSAPISTSGSQPQRQWERRCIWCDSTAHIQKTQCAEYKAALDNGVIGYSEQGKIKLMATGQELPVMFGKGGMKVLVPGKVTSVTTSSVTAVSGVSAITFEDGYGRLGGTVEAAQYEDDEWVGVDVDEKRKGDFIGPRRRVKPRIDGSQDTGGTGTADNSQEPRTQGEPRPVRITELPDDDMHDDQVPIASQRSSTTPAPPVNDGSNKPKFRLASELSQTVTTEDVGRKVMEAPIQLKMCELLAVSGEISSFIHDQTRKRRIPIAGESNAVSVDVNATQMSTVGKSLYACPSARVKVCLDDEVQVEALLDDGSELNLMGRDVFDQLRHPIDTDIDWKINGYDSGAERELVELNKKGNLIGVCHDVAVDVGGVIVKQHLFVVDHLASTDIILGRPWERMTRAQKTNMDDGSYHFKIKSLDGRRVVEFTVVPAQHERIREHVRSVALKEPGVRH